MVSKSDSRQNSLETNRKSPIHCLVPSLARLGHLPRTTSFRECGLSEPSLSGSPIRGRNRCYGESRSDGAELRICLSLYTLAAYLAIHFQLMLLFLSIYRFRFFFLHFLKHCFLLLPNPIEKSRTTWIWPLNVSQAALRDWFSSSRLAFSCSFLSYSLRRRWSCRTRRSRLRISS